MKAANPKKWAKLVGENKYGRPVYDVDPDKFYPVLMADFDFDEVDQYTLEVCYQAMKMDMQATYGFNIEIHVKGVAGHKDRWAIKGKSPGLGVPGALAMVGDEGSGERSNAARDHYKRVRGGLPA